MEQVKFSEEFDPQKASAIDLLREANLCELSDISTECSFKSVFESTEVANQEINQSSSSCDSLLEDLNLTNLLKLDTNYKKQQKNYSDELLSKFKNVAKTASKFDAHSLGEEVRGQGSSEIVPPARQCPPKKDIDELSRSSIDERRVENSKLDAQRYGMNPLQLGVLIEKMDFLRHCDLVRNGQKKSAKDDPGKNRSVQSMEQEPSKVESRSQAASNESSDSAMSEAKPGNNQEGKGVPPPPPVPTPCRYGGANPLQLGVLIDRNEFLAHCDEVKRGRRRWTGAKSRFGVRKMQPPATPTRMDPPPSLPRPVGGVDVSMAAAMNRNVNDLIQHFEIRTRSPPLQERESLSAGDFSRRLATPGRAPLRGQQTADDFLDSLTAYHLLKRALEDGGSTRQERRSLYSVLETFCFLFVLVVVFGHIFLV